VQSFYFYLVFLKKIIEYTNQIADLQSRLSLAEECQKQSIKIEKEYRQVIKILKSKMKITN
jgi:hypothetical protein